MALITATVSTWAEAETEIKWLGRGGGVKLPPICYERERRF